MDFVKDDFSNFPKLPDSREQKRYWLEDIADRIRSGGNLIERQTVADATSPSNIRR